MNDKAKALVIFVGGVAVGSLVTYFCAKKKINEKMDERVNAEIASMKEYYERKAAKLQSQANEEIKRDISFTIAKGDNGEIKAAAVEREEGPTEKKLVRSYTSYSMEKEDDEPSEKVHNATKDLRHLANQIITAEEFVNDNRFDKISLEYYDVDEALIESGELADIGSTIGFNALEHFGDTGEVDVVYVRNNRLGTDFEVIREHRSWYDPAEIDASPEE